MCSCKHCNKKFKHKRNLKASICKSCCNAKGRWKSKIELIELLGGKCSQCGYAGHPAALQFHHTNPKNKTYNLNSDKLTRKDRFKEAQKCILLCANCHTIHHANNKVLRSFNLVSKKIFTALDKLAALDLELGLL